MRRLLNAMSKAKVVKGKIRQSTLEETFGGRPRKSPRMNSDSNGTDGQVEKRELLAAAALKRSTSPKDVADEAEKPCASAANASRNDTMEVDSQDKELVQNLKKVHSLGPELQTFPALRSLTKLAPLKTTAEHTVFVKTNTINQGTPPDPYPQTYVDRWDTDHVRLPCSSQNVYPVSESGQSGNGPAEDKLRSRWEMIEEALLKPMESSVDLEEAILAYNSRYKGKWKFRELHRLCTEIMQPEEVKHVFGKTIPEMAKLALRLPKLCTTPIKLLKSGMNHSLTLSQEQIACLLAHAFFCTFPGRNSSRKAESNFPDINFSRLLDADCNGQKLICILHYFKRITESMPTGCVTFTRRSMNSLPDWLSSAQQLTELHVSQNGTIEDYGLGMLQMDFANKYVGGGVLNHGCVQEEIRFLICPEMIISRLFTEVLEDNECLIMIGCERFSLYSGYADSFMWDAPFVDETVRDLWGRRQCSVVAMDALCFYSPCKQYLKYCIDRELNKAFVSFFGEDSGPLPAVATGNWGCGAFNGDKEFKSLIQLLAAAQTRRDVVFFTFSDAKLMQDLFKIHAFLKEKKMGVGNIYMLLLKYNESCVKGGRRPKMSVFEYIYTTFEKSKDEKEEGVKNEDLQIRPHKEKKQDGEVGETQKTAGDKDKRYEAKPDIDEFSSPEEEEESGKSEKRAPEPSLPKKSVFDAIEENEK